MTPKEENTTYNGAPTRMELERKAIELIVHLSDNEILKLMEDIK